jgi:acetoacetyl-CoA synthetase
MDDFAVYNGKTVDLRPKMTDIVNGMKDVPEFSGMVSMPRFAKPYNITSIPRTQTLAHFVSKATSSDLLFEKTDFSDPFLIVYSSGTTGTPKCITHSIGGALLSSAKEAKLHREMNADSVSLQYTTTGWIMYFSSIMNLLPGARVILYDGSPFQPDITTFVKLIGDQRVTKLGTSPRWMHELQKNGIVPKEVTDLSALKVVTSTGMVLSDQLFEWFYDVGFPKSVHLANISGGTDLVSLVQFPDDFQDCVRWSLGLLPCMLFFSPAIHAPLGSMRKTKEVADFSQAGCFGQENPLTPVYVGGTQGPSLGTPVAVYDSLIEGGKGIPGVPVDHGVPGELVAPAAFPNMPVYFWNDTSGSRYFGAYFEKYDNVWTHGDFVMIHPVTKNLLFLGRADGVLNPSGVRFGSAEIYSVLEAAFPMLADSICVGQRRPQDADETVLLFLLMKPGEKFTQQLVNDVKAAIRKELSARHVPKYVFETPAIPVYRPQSYLSLWKASNFVFRQPSI